MKYRLLKYMMLGCFMTLIHISMSGQNLSAFKIFTKDGKATKYGKMIKSVSKSDMVFFGELHNNPIAHYLEMKLVKSLHSGNELLIAMEMFETDTQEALDTYLEGNLETKDFLEKTRAWKNYATDYDQIIQYAKKHKLPVIASNVPRRYANMVYKDGFEVIESLVVNEKQWIAPLPIPYDATLPGYVKMLEMVAGHGGDNFPKAQAIKDATMAHSIVNQWNPGKKVLHINGSYHSENYEGICWYVNTYDDSITMSTITTVVQENLDALESEHLGKADYIVVIDSDVTTSY